MSDSVAVVVVTYNSATTIGPLLDSLPAAAGSLSYRTVVVDNGSSDTTREVVAGRTDARLEPAPNHGYASGLNRGVAVLGGSGPILMLNPDCVLEPACLERLVETLTTTGAGIVVPLIRGSDHAVARSLRRQPSLLRSIGFGESRHPALGETVSDEDAYRTRHPVAWATGAVMLVARACYEALDGLDESFFMYSEETDFCFRARELGYLTYFEPTAEAMHIGAGSGQSPELYAMQVLNRVRLYRRSHGPAATVAFLLLTLGRELLRALGGDAEARRAVEAVVRPGRRPAQLGWRGSLLRRSRPARRHAEPGSL